MLTFQSSNSSKERLPIQHMLTPGSSKLEFNDQSQKSKRDSVPDDLPIAELIDKLFDCCASAFDTVAKQQPYSAPSKQLTVQMTYRSWVENIETLRSHYTACDYQRDKGPSAKDLMQIGRYPALCAQLFQILAETYFQAFKVYHALLSPTIPFPATSTVYTAESESTIWTRNYILNRTAFRSANNLAMQLITAHASFFGFTLDGLKAYNQRASEERRGREEDYSLLYRDDANENVRAVAIQRALSAEAQRWEAEMRKLGDEFGDLRRRASDMSGEGMVKTIKKTNEGYEVKERWYT